MLSSAQSVALYHSTNWRWVLDAPHSGTGARRAHVVGPRVSAVTTASARRNDSWRSVLALQVVGSFYLQFFRDSGCSSSTTTSRCCGRPSCSSQRRRCASSVARCCAIPGGGDGCRRAWSSRSCGAGLAPRADLVRVRRRVGHGRARDRRHHGARSPQFERTQRRGRRRLPRRDVSSSPSRNHPRRVRPVVGRPRSRNRTTSWCSATRARPNAISTSLRATSTTSSHHPRNPACRSCCGGRRVGPSRSASRPPNTDGWRTPSSVCQTCRPRMSNGSTACARTSSCCCRRANPTWTAVSRRCAPPSRMRRCQHRHGCTTVADKHSSHACVTMGLRPARTG